MKYQVANIHNQYQGNSKKVLIVCSLGLLRSPSAAVVLSQEPFNFNTRSCGSDTEFALIPVDNVLLAWADEIVCMEFKHREAINKLLYKYNLMKLIVTLDIEDKYEYMQRELVELIKERYNARTL